MGRGGLACSNKAKKGSKVWKEGLEGPRDRSDGSQRLLSGVWKCSDSQWLSQLLLSAKLRRFLSRTPLFSRNPAKIQLVKEAGKAGLTWDFDGIPRKKMSPRQST